MEDPIDNDIEDDSFRELDEDEDWAIANPDAVKIPDYYDRSDPSEIKIKEEYKDRFIMKRDSKGEPYVEDVNKSRKEEESIIFVFDDSNQPQLIDHALGSIIINDKSIRYFGVKMPQKHNILVKGNLVLVTSEEPALITEDRHIISQYCKPDGVNFKFETIMSLKRNRWAKKYFQKFLDDSKYDVTFKEAYLSTKKFYDDNMCYEDSTAYKFNATMDVVSYQRDLVDKAVIVKHEGVSGSAKSKSMSISANLSFNGRKWIKLTPANFFRYRHFNKATLYIDEAEKLFDEKNKSSSDNELVEYLNSSYEKESFVPRQNDKNLNQTDEFDSFGFTQIASIKPLQGALKQRSLTQHMIKAKNNDSRSNTEIPKEMNEEYVKCRAMLYTSSLLHYKEFIDAQNNIKNSFGLANREWNIAKPVIAMAYCIDPELADEIGKYMAKLFYVRDGDIDET